MMLKAQEAARRSDENGKRQADSLVEECVLKAVEGGQYQALTVVRSDFAAYVDTLLDSYGYRYSRRVVSTGVQYIIRWGPEASDHPEVSWEEVKVLLEDRIILRHDLSTRDQDYLERARTADPVRYKQFADQFSAQLACGLVTESDRG